MVSVTKRIKSIKQPRGGYLPLKSFEKIELPVGQDLATDENLSASLVGMAVDYLTRFSSGTSVEEAFSISLQGAAALDFYSRTDNKNVHHALQLLKTITLPIDDEGIISACKLSGFDVVYRSGLFGYRPVGDIFPDDNTISNIKIMLDRSKSFFDTYGPVVANGFSFDGVYTDLITTGDGDYLTADTLWDFKVSKALKPTIQNSLQILIYYIMGKETDNPAFQNITKLGIFNPRHNVIHIIETSSIPEETLATVSNEVIGY